MALKQSTWSPCRRRYTAPIGWFGSRFQASVKSAMTGTCTGVPSAGKASSEATRRNGCVAVLAAALFAPQERIEKRRQARREGNKADKRADDRRGDRGQDMLRRGGVLGAGFEAKAAADRRVAWRGLSDLAIESLQVQVQGSTFKDDGHAAIQLDVIIANFGTWNFEPSANGGLFHRLADSVKDERLHLGERTLDECAGCRFVPAAAPYSRPACCNRRSTGCGS